MLPFYFITTFTLRRPVFTMAMLPAGMLVLTTACPPWQAPAPAFTPSVP